MPHRGSIGKGAFAFLEVPLPAPIDVQNQILGRTSAEQLAQQDRREGVDRGALRTCS